MRASIRGGLGWVSAVGSLALGSAACELDAPVGRSQSRAWAPVSPNADPRPAPPPSLAEWLKKNGDQMTEAIAERRAFTLRDRVPILVQEDNEFFGALKAASGWLKTGDVPPAATRAFYLAFNFPLREATSPPPSEGASPKRPDARKKESAPEAGEVVGFYDRSTGRVHVRARELRVAAAERRTEAARATVVHEIAHALQHQRLPDVEVSAGDDDETLARLALFEGDAEVTAIVVRAERADVSAKDVLAAIADAIRDGTHDRLLAADPRAAGLLASAANERERLMFPYTHGASFVGDLFRTGGFKLVDAAFLRPPKSSEQVLHPKKYLEGELPIPVQFPEPPAGYGPVIRGKMGELLTRVVLSQCLPREEAERMAEGWGGDAYLVVQNDKKQLGLLWSTAWDDEASATRFAAALSANSLCWKKGHAAWRDASISDEHWVKRSSNRVSFVRGIADGEGLAQSLLGLPGVPLAPMPPFSNVSEIRVHTPEAPARSTGWKSTGKTMQSTVMDVALPIDSACKTETAAERFEMRCGGSDQLSVLFEVVRDLPSDADAALDEIGRRTLAEDGGVAARPFPSVVMGLRVGQAVARSSGAMTGGRGNRVMVVPLCGGTTAYAITLRWSSEKARRRAVDWTSGARRLTPSTDPPSCAGSPRAK